MKTRTIGLIIGLMLSTTVMAAVNEDIPNAGYAEQPQSGPAMVCEVVGTIRTGAISNTSMTRCTDRERDVTCYSLNPVGTSPSLQCLPNQWLNYPQSIANYNDPMAK